MIAAWIPAVLAQTPEAPAVLSGGQGVNANLFVVIAVSAIFYGTPLLLAALGEMLTERSGILNLGVEGMMLMGAVAAAWTWMHVSGSEG